MALEARHKYLVVLGSCCTADAIRTKDLQDIRGARLRLLSYQGRTSLLSMTSRGLETSEFRYTDECETTPMPNWGLAMVTDELQKRHQSRLLEVIEMSDALIIDTVSAFVFPYLVSRRGDRYFLRSKEWDRYIELRTELKQVYLWEIPIQLSITGLRKVLEPLYCRKPNLRVIFHFPRPCFNDGIGFDDPLLTENFNYYDFYNKRLYGEACRMFPRVAVVSCGGERADPSHYNYPYPFHYDGRYMESLRKEIERLLE